MTTALTDTSSPELLHSINTCSWDVFRSNHWRQQEKSKPMKEAGEINLIVISKQELVKFSDPITKEHKKITKRPRKDHTPVRRRGYQTHWWVKDGTRTRTYYLAPASSWRRGWCPLPPRWGMTMQHSSKIQYMLLLSFQIQPLKITKRSYLVQVL